MNISSRAIHFAGAKKVIQDASVGAAHTSQKVWNSFTADTQVVSGVGVPASQQLPSVDGSDQVSDANQLTHSSVAFSAPPAGHPIWSDSAVFAEGTHGSPRTARALEPLASARLAWLPPAPKGYSPQQWASALNSYVTKAPRGPPLPSGSPFPRPAVTPEAAAIARRYLARAGAPQPNAARQAPADSSARARCDAPHAASAAWAPEAAAAPREVRTGASSGGAATAPAAARTPTVEQQIHALPRHLLDSDSESEAPSTPPFSPALESPLAAATAPLAPPQARRTAASWLPAAAAGFSLFENGGALSHDAPPFVPAAAAAAGSTAALLAALRRAGTIEALMALLTQHDAAIDGECVVAAALRLAVLAPGATPERHARAHAAAEHLAARAVRCAKTLTTERLTVFLGAYHALGAPHASPAAQELLLAAAQGAAVAPTLPALAVVVHGLRVAPPDAGGEAAGLAAAAAEALLAASTLEDLPAAAVPVCAAALLLGDRFPPAALSTLGHAACMHVDELSAAEIVEVLRALVAAGSSDAALLKLLAGAFHKRMPEWDVPSVMAFLSACRAHKPLLAAQRAHSTLVAILDFLETRGAAAATPHLSTLLLDLAFIGCQSFKAHGVLARVSGELLARVRDGRAGAAHAVQLADSVRALDKLEHPHEGLYAAVGPLLAAGELPAKHLANAVVSLAKHGALAPALAARARAALQRDFAACNGQDVSQLLFGLMLDHAVTGDANTPAAFAAIAPALAAALAEDASFQPQAVSRIVSSYAKVGCYAPAVFAAAAARLGPAVGDLKPAFVAELLWSMAEAGQAEPAFMRRAGAAIKRRFAELSPATLCGVLASYARGGAFHADVFNMACSKLASLIARGQLPSQDTSQAVAAIATAQFRHTAMLRAAHDWLLQQAAAVPPADAASLLASLHAFGAASARLCDRTARPLAAGLPTLAATDKPALAGAVWALGGRGGEAPGAAALEAALSRLRALGGSAGLPPAALAQVARGASAYVVAAGAAGPPPEAAAALVDAADVAAAAVPAFAGQPAALVDALAGVAGGGHKAPALMAAASAPLARAAHALSAAQLCDAAAAYSRVNCQEPRLFAALAPAVQVHVARGALSAEQAATLAWAFALQGSLHGPLVPALCQIAADAADREHETYQLRRAAPALGALGLCQLHLVSLLSKQACLVDHLADAPVAWQMGAASPHLLPPALEAAAAAAHGASLRALRGAQRRSGAHAARTAAAGGALAAVTRCRVTAEAPFGISSVVEGLEDFVDAWAAPDAAAPVALLQLSDAHTLPLSPGQVQGWAAAVVRALRTGVRTVVVPADAPAEALPSLIREQLSGPL